MKGCNIKNKSFYEILGISHFSNQDEIKLAYHKLAKKYHPDINPKTGNLFKEINIAYETLSDPILRDKYDLSLKLESIVKVQEKNKNKAVKRHENKINKKSAKEQLNEINEYFRKKYEEESFTDFYKDFKYYQNPKKETIFDIIYNWNKYRFENAIAAIWNRNFLALFGVFFVYLLATLAILSTKIFKNLKLKERKRYTWNWISHLVNLNYINKFWKTFIWTWLLLILAISKLIFTILYMIYWIFRNVLRFFLLPVTIIIAVFGRYLLVFLFGRRLFR